MAVKGTIQKDFIRKNKYTLMFIGLPKLTATEITGSEREITSVVLPDQTVQSGGLVLPSEFDITIPMHHKLEIAAMEAWCVEGEDPISPFFKKHGLIMALNGSGLVATVWRVESAGCFKRALPDFSMENEGEMQQNVYSIKCDDIKLQA